MRLIYPFYEIDHEHYSQRAVRIVEFPELIQYQIKYTAPDNIFDIINSTSIKLARIIKTEYRSWSGKHVVEPVYIKPIFVTHGSDYYAFRELCKFKYAYELPPRLRSKIFKKAKDLFMELSSYCIESVLPQNITIRRIGGFCWAVTNVFDSCLIVEPVTVEELIDAMKRFTTTYFFDLLPYMQRVER